MSLACFKTYDVRGRVPGELNPEIAYHIGSAFASLTGAEAVAVGRDMRLSSPELAEAVARGVRSQGGRVVDLGLCGTELVYFATFSMGLDGGIMVTASHNPAEYNGLKMVGRNAAPIDADEFGRLAALAADPPRPAGARVGEVRQLDVVDEYLDLVTKLFPPADVGSWKVVCDAGNGAIGPLLTRLADRYPDLRLIVLNGEPDGTFPRGVPNPLLPENRDFTARAVLEHGADLGVAWDGDYDRCFLFDRRGEFVDNYYLLSALAGSYLEAEPGGTILYDPRLTWNTVDTVEAAGGVARLCRTGHVFFKRDMRTSGAIYGAEMSGHHYFRDFGCCDSGVLPWLCALKMLRRKGWDLADLVDDGRRRFPISGEINREVEDSVRAIEAVRSAYQAHAVARCELDGIGLEFDTWRFNLRRSNTEPLVRLNVESRGDRAQVDDQTRRILDILERVGGEMFI